MPDKNINIDTDVILRYLEKTASPEEIRQLREWIALSEENANYFQEIRNIWEVTTPAVDPEKIDTGKALAKVKNRIHTTPQAPVKRTRLITYCRRIAAILLLPAIIAVVALLMKKDYQAPLIAFNEVTAVDYKLKKGGRWVELSIKVQPSVASRPSSSGISSLVCICLSPS